jgi:hypothetical protein
MRDRQDDPNEPFVELLGTCFLFSGTQVISTPAHLLRISLGSSARLQAE